MVVNGNIVWHSHLMTQSHRCVVQVLTDFHEHTFQNLVLGCLCCLIRVRHVHWIYEISHFGISDGKVVFSLL